MENAFGRIVSIMVCVVLMFIIPFMYAEKRTEYVQQMYVTEKTVEFVDSVRNTGRITKDMLELYKRQIDGLSGRRQIKMTHVIHGVSGKEQTDTEYDISDIEREIYENNRDYGFRKDEYFKVLVLKSGKYGSADAVCTYGGYIRNETY